MQQSAKNRVQTKCDIKAINLEVVEDPCNIVSCGHEGPLHP